MGEDAQNCRIANESGWQGLEWEYEPEVHDWGVWDSNPTKRVTSEIVQLSLPSMSSGTHWIQLARGVTGAVLSSETEEPGGTGTMLAVSPFQNKIGQRTFQIAL